MAKHPSLFVAIAATAILLVGCDSFAVLEQFHKGPLSLTVEKDSVQQGETIGLSPAGGAPPYSYVLVEGALYFAGTLGSVSGNTYTAGSSIGTVIIQLTDTDGTSVDAVVTIIPPTPASFIAQPNAATPTANDILLSWSYADTSLISGFQIQRSSDGSTFTALATQQSTATSYVDSPLNPNQTYYYRMYAVADAYQSLPTVVLGSTP